MDDGAGLPSVLSRTSALNHYCCMFVIYLFIHFSKCTIIFIHAVHVCIILCYIGNLQCTVHDMKTESELFGITMIIVLTMYTLHVI